MPLAKADIEKAIPIWKLAIKSEHGLAIQVDIDRRQFLNILLEARRVNISTEESYELVVIIPEQPDDEVWIVRRYDDNTAHTTQSTNNPPDEE